MNKHHISHVKAGDYLAEPDFNAIIDAIVPFSKISTPTGGYLTCSTGPYGTSLYLGLPSDTMARLIGDTSPYSWQGVHRDGSGDWVDGPNLSYNGTSEAYEANGASGLDGKVVRMTWESSGDWRFQAVRHGTPPPCESGQICVTVQQSGCAIDLVGVTVTITDDADPPNVIGSGSASGSPAKYCVDIPEAGTYHVTSHVFGSAADQTATITAACGETTNVTLTYPTNTLGRVCITLQDCDCEGPHLVEPGVTATDASTGETATGVFDPEAGATCFIAARKASGGYGVTISYNGMVVTGTTFNPPACGTSEFFYFSASGTPVRFRAALGCGTPLTFYDEGSGDMMGTGSVSASTPEPGNPSIGTGTTCVTFDKSYFGVNIPVRVDIDTGGTFGDTFLLTNLSCGTPDFPLVLDISPFC